MRIVEECRILQEKPTRTRKGYVVECEQGHKYTTYATGFNADRICKVCRFHGDNDLSAQANAYSSHRNSGTKRHNSYLEKDLWLRVVSSPCVYCLTQNSCCSKYQAGQFEYNSVDRLDSGIGYRPGNVVPACLTCNKAKSALSLEEFLQYLSRFGADVSAIRERISKWLT